ncbi:mechanosensitive ion channel family protein [Edaphobacter sp. HDX4]
MLPRFESNIGLLSDDPSGTVEPGLPPGQARAGVLDVGGKNTDVLLVRVEDPDSGKIWLISQQTVDLVPNLVEAMKNETPKPGAGITKTAFGSRRMLGMSLNQWLAWLLSIPISWLLAWLFALVVSMPRRIWCRVRKRRFLSVWQTPIGMPLRCITASVMHGIFVYWIQAPLLYRAHYFRFLTALMVGCVAWLISRITDQGFRRMLERTRVSSRGGESVVILLHRLTHIIMFLFAVVAILAVFGLDVKTALTGLGIGGLAVALGAQKTLENLIGGVSLLLDKAVNVGDFCKVGDRLGTVEDIGLRSLKLRTLDQNLLVVPNGVLAQMQFENMRARPKLLMNQNFSLRMETQAGQLRFVLERVKIMLDEHPAIEAGSSRVRVIGFDGAAFQFELFAYGKTGDWAEFTGIRQDILLKIAEIVEAAGTRFAAPARLIYLSTDAGVDQEASEIGGNVTELRHGEDTVRSPGESRTGTK